jgi:hypothetical protein
MKAADGFEIRVERFAVASVESRDELLGRFFGYGFDLF